jgi:hypothetical protein
MAIVELLTYSLSGEPNEDTSIAADRLIELCRAHPDGKLDNGDVLRQQLEDLDAPGSIGRRIATVAASGCR